MVKRSSMKPARTPSRAQDKLREEFCGAYGIKPEQVSFDGPSPDPIFDFDALSLLINTLADIPGIKVGLQKFDDANKLAESFCQMTLHGRRTRDFFGVAMIGEQMHDGTVITGTIQAINVSRARALRIGLRSIGFDPVKFHEARKAGRTLDLLGSDEESAKRDLATIHVLAGARGANFIKRNGDRTEYENLLAAHFHGHTSSKDLEPHERAEWIGMLRAWVSGMERAA
jgi:hypothetical protein